MKAISSNEKLLKIVKRITDEHSYGSLHDEKVKRWNLKQYIIEELGITGYNTLCNWINVLLAKHIISPNPHTQLMMNRSGMIGRERYIIKPSNDTLYFINWKKIEDYLRKSSSQTHLLSS